MDKFCEEKGFIGWHETSAKENINIDEACKFLVQKVSIRVGTCILVPVTSNSMISRVI